jgi:hypothetical protein
MRSSSTSFFVFIVLFALSAVFAAAQINPVPHDAPLKPPVSGWGISGSTIALHPSSTMNLASEMGGAFMSPSKCDADGNLYIRKYAMDRPLLSPVAKIDAEGKRTALFDPVAFPQLQLDRADAFSPDPDGALYQIAWAGIEKPQIYVIHFSSDGSPSTPIRLDADFEPYQFAAFPSGNFLVSGMQRDLGDRDRLNAGRPFTAVFSADGRLLAQLSFETAPGPAASSGKAAGKPAAKAAGTDTKKPVPNLDLSDAEVGADGNIYALRRSSPALVYVISPAGKIVSTVMVSAPVAGVMPDAFHVSKNRMAISFWNDEGQSRIIVVSDAQTGQSIGTYSGAAGLGQSFACYSADDAVFTFLHLGEKNELEVVRAEAR